MKRRGFTLIELLAVIVILAIIALIATPIVMNLIENSKKGAVERSAGNYVRVVETAIATERLDGPVEDGEYTVDDSGNLVLGETTIKVEVNGDKPSTGSKVKISNGLVDKTNTTLTISGYPLIYNADAKVFKVSENNEANDPVTVYRWSEDTVDIGAELSSFTYVENPSDLGKNYYLKHEVENNVVTASYSCAKFNNKETCLRGGSADYYGYAENAANYTGNALILKGLDDEGFYCSFSDSSSLCSDGSITLWADSDGNVNANNASDYCYVYGNGRSYCLSD